MIGRLLFTTALVGIALTANAMAAPSTIVLTPEQIKWGPAPSLPAGWEAAVLAGDPTKKGPYVERVKLPPNAAIPPHSHPDDENITVLSGSFGIGEGAVADHAKGRVLAPGSFYHLPANTAHFAWAGADGAVLQIHGIGPSGLKLLKPAAK
jgi:quercetin dioxygenase-like cupin family protein